MPNESVTASALTTDPPVPAAQVTLTPEAGNPKSVDQFDRDDALRTRTPDDAVKEIASQRNHIGCRSGRTEK